MKIKHVYGNVLKLDIPLTIKIRTIEDGAPSEREEPFYPDATKGCIVELANNYNRKIEYEATINDNIAHIEDSGKISIGQYKLTVKCYDADGNPYRYMVRDIVEICDATADAGIEAGVEFDAETYTLDGAVFSVMRGFSAYEIWLQHGHEGTEEDFLEWLRDDSMSGEYINNENNVFGLHAKWNTYLVLKNPVNILNLVTDAISEAGAAHSTVIFTAAANLMLSVTSGVNTTTSQQGSPKFIEGNIYVMRFVGVRNEEDTTTHIVCWFDSKLATVAYTGSYNDLEDKPTIPDTSTFVPTSRKVNGKDLTGDITLGAGDVGALPASTPIPASVTEQTVASWGFTKNTGTYSKPSTGIPASDLEEGVIPSLAGYATETWVGQQGFITRHQDISGKEDKVVIATTLPATLESGKYYRLGTVGTLSAALPTVSDTEHAASIMIGLTASADITPALTSSASVYYQEGFEIKSGGTYEINCLFNGSYWCVTCIKFETT